MNFNLIMKILHLSIMLWSFSLLIRFPSNECIIVMLINLISSQNRNIFWLTIMSSVSLSPLSLSLSVCVCVRERESARAQPYIDLSSFTVCILQGTTSKMRDDGIGWQQQILGPTATGRTPFLAQINPAPFGPSNSFVPNTPLETALPTVGAKKNASIFHLMGKLSPYFPNLTWVHRWQWWRRRRADDGSGLGAQEYPLPPGAHIDQVHMIHRHAIPSKTPVSRSLERPWPRTSKKEPSSPVHCLFWTRGSTDLGETHRNAYFMTRGVLMRTGTEPASWFRLGGRSENVNMTQMDRRLKSIADFLTRESYTIMTMTISTIPAAKSLLGQPPKIGCWKAPSIFWPAFLVWSGRKTWRWRWRSRKTSSTTVWQNTIIAITPIWR